MLNKLIRLMDMMLFLFFVLFYVAVSVFLIFAGFLYRRRQNPSEKIVQLYLSIIDFRYSIVSTYRDDVLVDGMIAKSICFHFDFEIAKDETAVINDRIIMHNISVHPDSFLTRAGFRKTRASIAVLKTLFAMMSISVKERVNIIRAHDPHMLGFNAFVISRLLNVPYIVQVCSNYELKDRQAKGITFGPFMFKSIERAFERFIMFKSDMVATDRENYKDFGIIPADIEPEKYTNFGFFVDGVHYKEPSEHNDMKVKLGFKGKKILLYVGRLAAVKYPRGLIEMLEVCVKSCKDITLLLAGDGPLKGELKQEIEKRGLSKNVEFLNSIPQSELPDLYAAADVVVFTSAGFTLIEAGLAGRAIVAYDFEWHKEFIRKNENGILVPFGDNVKFASEVLRLLDDDDARDRLGKAARSYAMENYTREKAVLREKVMYQKILKKRGYAFAETL